MKRHILFTMFVGLLLWSCGGNQSADPTPTDPVEDVLGCTDPQATNYNKDANVADCSCEYSMTSDASQSPAEFTKKVVLEEFTGTWCGWCTDGAWILHKLIEENNGQVIGAGIHQGDAMEIGPLFNFLDKLLNVTGFPSGAVNRSNGAIFRGEWASKVQSELSKSASAGVAIDTEIDGDKLNILVTTSTLNKLLGTHDLTVYLSENGVIASQRNYCTGDNPGCQDDNPANALPDPITDYEHEHVIREVLTSVEGDELPTCATEAGGTFRKMFTVDISGYEPANLEVIAILAKSSSIVNANKVVAGESVDFMDKDQ